MFKIEGPKTKTLNVLKLYKGKVYSKGIVFLPVEVRTALGLKDGSPIVLELKDKKLVIRPVEEKFAMLVERAYDEIREYAWLLRGAYGDALEFFKKLSKAPTYVYGRDFEVGEDKTLNEVYLKLEEGILQEVPHFSYFEDLTYREGVITLELGKSNAGERLIEELLASFPENLRSSLKPLERKETGMGLKVIQSPRFSEEELGLLVYLASRVLDRALATS